MLTSMVLREQGNKSQAEVWTNVVHPHSGLLLSHENE